MAPRYLSVATLKAYVQSSLVLADTLYEDAIKAAEMILDNACQRKFALADAVATPRSFKASGCSDRILIHDCTEITSVVDNGTTLVAGTTYQAEPLNGLSSAGEAWPYYVLRKPYGGTWYPTSTLATVVVTAKWGWPAIPPQIVEACKIIAKDTFSQRDIKFGLVAVSEAGGVGTRENRIVRDAVRDYSHPAAMGIA